jgi:hypothetical protein
MFDIRRINSQCQNVVIAFYPKNAGGKFLLNCMALSDGFVLQCQNLAEQQMCGELTARKKLDLLLCRLKETKDRWNDLELGCAQLWGDTSFQRDARPGFSLSRCKLFPVIAKLSWSHLYFPMIIHDLPTLEIAVQSWPNCRILVLENSESFVAQYRPLKMLRTWQQLRGAGWPEQVPTTLDQYYDLPEFVQRELENFQVSNLLLQSLLWEKDQLALFQDHRERLQTVLDKHRHEKWNVNWYLDRDVFCEAIKKLYESYNLEDFVAANVLEYRDLYMATLDRLVQHHAVTA